jgi:hypothetical protein
VPRCWEKRLGIEAHGTVTRELGNHVISDRRFSLLGVPAERVLELVERGGPKHYARLVAQLFDLHGEVTGNRSSARKRRVMFATSRSCTCSGPT